MEILRITLFVVSTVCYGAIIFFTLRAYRRLQRQQEDMKELKFVSFRVFAIVSALKLQVELDMIAKMKQAMKDCIEQEDFEEATRLKELIDRQEKQATQLVKEFKDAFGGMFEICTFKIPL